MSARLLRIPDVTSKTGMSRSTIYLRIEQGLWTKPVSLGPRMVGWPDYEIHVLNAARIAGKGDHEIEDLVVRLEADRKGAMCEIGNMVGKDTSGRIQAIAAAECNCNTSLDTVHVRGSCVDCGSGCMPSTREGGAS